jgi:hypothetical protein
MYETENDLRRAHEIRSLSPDPPTSILRKNKLTLSRFKKQRPTYSLAI